MNCTHTTQNAFYLFQKGAKCNLKLHIAHFSLQRFVRSALWNCILKGHIAHIITEFCVKCNLTLHIEGVHAHWTFSSRGFCAKCNFAHWKGGCTREVAAAALRFQFWTIPSNLLGTRSTNWTLNILELRSWHISLPRQELVSTLGLGLRLANGPHWTSPYTHLSSHPSNQLQTNCIRFWNDSIRLTRNLISKQEFSEYRSIVTRYHF